jgi:hypothetical protein
VYLCRVFLCSRYAVKIPCDFVFSLAGIFSVKSVPSDTCPRHATKGVFVGVVWEAASREADVASIRAKSNGLTLTRFVQNEIHPIMGAGWPALAPET